MHFLGFPIEDPPFDLSLLVELRDESFPLERLAHFARLGAWVVDPFAPIHIEWAAMTAVSRAVRETLKGKNPELGRKKNIERYLRKVQEAHFPLRKVSFGLLRMPGLELWSDWHEKSSSISDVALRVSMALLKLDQHAPSGILPSMNRAIQLATRSGEFSDPMSETKIKEIWRFNGHVTPFLMAERLFEFHDEEDEDVSYWSKRLLSWDPSDRNCVEIYWMLLETDAIYHMMGTAKYLQRRLAEVLAKIKASEVDFVEFPADLPEIEVEIPAFTPAELRDIENYSSRG